MGLIKGRPLYDWEIVEARLVFGDRLNFARVRVHENANWTDSLDRFGRWLRRMKRPPGTHNAITLGYHCCFPIKFPQTHPPPLAEDAFLMGWLIHELTHVWQFERMGWVYLARALQAQLR